MNRNTDMRKTSLIGLAAVVLLAATGCGNRIVGHNLKEEGHWYGELGITGHLNEVTIKSRSELTKLSIIGDANHVIVEDRTVLGKIEVWGENNTISIPERLVVRINQWGKGTQVIRRPAEAPRVTEPPAREPPIEAFPSGEMEEPAATSSQKPVTGESEPAADPNAVPE
jgi:hypothetical protein